MLLSFIIDVLCAPFKKKENPNIGKGYQETSREAYEAALPTMPTTKERVLAFIESCGYRGATDQEVQHSIGMHIGTQGPARFGLVQDGLVIKTDMRRPTASGRNAIVWVAKQYAASIAA